MNEDPNDGQADQDHADDIQVIIPVGTDHIRFARNYAFQVSACRADFRDLVFVQGGHQLRIGGMALLAVPDGLFLWQDLMSNQETVILFFGVTFNAADRPEMDFLIRQPGMGKHQVGILFFGQELEPGIIDMAIEADCIIVNNGFLDVFIGPGIDLISVGIMTHPAGKILAVFL